MASATGSGQYDARWFGVCIDRWPGFFVNAHHFWPVQCLYTLQLFECAISIDLIFLERIKLKKLKFQDFINKKNFFHKLHTLICCFWESCAYTGYWFNYTLNYCLFCSENCYVIDGVLSPATNAIPSISLTVIAPTLFVAPQMNKCLVAAQNF